MIIYLPEVPGVLNIIGLLLLFISINIFICKQVMSDAGARTILFLVQASPLVAAFLWFGKSIENELLPTLLIINCLFTCVSILIYYHDLFKDPPDKVIWRQPTFLLFTAILMLSTAVIPGMIICYQSKVWSE